MANQQFSYICVNVVQNWQWEKELSLFQTLASSLFRSPASFRRARVILCGDWYSLLKMLRSTLYWSFTWSLKSFFDPEVLVSRAACGVSRIFGPSWADAVGFLFFWRLFQ